MTHSEHRDISRWIDNPFTPPNASPELLEWYDKRDEAIRIWRETGDDTMAIDIGLFPSKEEENELQEAPTLSTTNIPNRPIPNSYWVKPGRLISGEYPGAVDRDEAAATLRALLGSGVDHFIDLTGEADMLKPYIQIAEEESSRLGRSINRESHPIDDLSVPRTPDQMTTILDAIDNALDNDRTVYVHCWGGVGRTGTVIGCWLVRHGLTGEDALAQVAEWWKDVEKAYRAPCSPETYEQRQYVLGWRESMDRETSA